MSARLRLGVLCGLALLCAVLASAHARADSKRAESKRAHAAADPLADTDSDADDLAAAPAADAQPAPESDATPAAAEAQPDAAETAAPADEAAAPAEPEAPSLEVEPFAGGGLGTRAIERPTPLGVQRLNTTVFPAIDIGLRIVGWPRAAFSLGGLLHYQTSLGMSVREQPPFALDNEVSVRSERVELSVAPTFRLGDSPAAPALGFPIGFALRTFWPHVHHLMTPGFTLGGPLLRAELIVPGGELFLLRIGPELQWIFMIDHALTNDGVAAQAFAIGGDATLALRLSPIFALQLIYREAHAFASNAKVGGASFSDVERFLTLGLSGRL